MKLIEQEATVLGECPSDVEEAILWIEKAGRVCYKSEDRIVEGSGKKFVNGIVKRGHFSVIEHSNMVIRSPEQPIFPNKYLDKVNSFYTSKFLHSIVHDGYIYTGGNFRAWMEELKLFSIDDLYIFHNDMIMGQKDIPNVLKMISVEFITDRAITHELVRHRPASYSQESQRYCAYKTHLDFINQWWWNTDDIFDFVGILADVENYYTMLLENGIKAERARFILPNCVATKIVMTASIPEWDHVFNMRCSKAAYPGIRKLMEPVREEFIDNGWVV